MEPLNKEEENLYFKSNPHTDEETKENSQIESPKKEEG